MWFKHVISITPLLSVGKRARVVKVFALTPKRAVLKARKKYPYQACVYHYLGRCK